jgi:succinate dehydrogenase / fumarate reductase flavoprotein subunit
MQESLRLVEKTRPNRVGKALPEMTADEKDKVLQDWHPDFKSDQKRALKIGPSKGMLVPHEVADNLEAHTIIKPGDIDLSNIDYDVDVLIIGAGGTGLSAALLTQENGIPTEKILMIQKLRLGDANSKMSQGGIQAADASDDNPAIHYLDVMGGGHYENKPELVELLVKEGPDVIKWHEELGVLYDKLEDGSMQLAPGGGTSRKRMHSCKDYTGLEITRVLIDEFLSREIPYLELTSAVEFIMDDKDQVAGAVGRQGPSRRSRPLRHGPRRVQDLQS